MNSFKLNIEGKELIAALELFLISVVFLNLFPNKGFGPWKAFNPYQIWLMVVLVATISFVAYFVMKLVGPKKGVLLTGLISGFISSTVLTLHFSKFANEKKEMSSFYSIGILLACSVMYLRGLLLILILNPTLFPPLFIAFFLISASLLIVAYMIWRKSETIELHPQKPVIKNPLDLRTALLFGALLSVITILVNGIQQTIGETGIYAFSGLSGLIDIDAITIALARISVNESWIKVAVISIILATSVNNIIKACLAYFLGGRQMLYTVCLPLLSTVAIGLLFSWIYFFK